ncbi:hypothetical protein B0A48_03645 [Cryoendolithus antarcticus]|uniref:Transcription initiation factor TFIID subunit 9 n=1 Tax=Cryoendolithus antarcticus TaxID=1507870 RepID=A0A1V8TL10_9PEZI|nr:hypothetical protein B0A48_03645 [Cryoendolithus antarcticus]
MASPQVNGHPSTPPPSDPFPPAPSAAQSFVPDLAAPRASLQDDGLSKRPRDARLIHTILQNLGVQSYQERVPLQLMDFAYRYTSSVLSDALRLSGEGYAHAAERGNKRVKDEDVGSNITVTALRQAVATRQGHAFEGALPKEYLMGLAAERNRVALPKVESGIGLQLPDEKYCLTGIGWRLKEEWDEEIDDEEDGEGVPIVNGVAAAEGGGSDARMGGMDGAMDVDGEEDEDEEGGGKMEDIFGDEAPEGQDTMKED